MLVAPNRYKKTRMEFKANVSDINLECTNVEKIASGAGNASNQIGTVNQYSCGFYNHVSRCIPWAVLAAVPAPGVGVEFLDHGLIFVWVGQVCPCAGAGHGGAEEHVDDEHEEEEDPEHDAEVEQPGRVGTSADAVSAEGVHIYESKKKIVGIKYIIDLTN